MTNYEKFEKKVFDFVNEIENNLTNYYSNINRIEEFNFIKVLEAFRKNKIEESHFQESTGYGYTDIGRDKIEDVYKDVFHTEDALVRQQIVSGTHAISLALFSITKYGDEILSITGLPYDTLLSTIGENNEEGSLREYGVSFKYVDLKNDGSFDYDLIKNSINNNTKIIYIQRSRGYSMRPSISVLDIKNIIDIVKSINNKLIVLVDNCYGEFTDTIEPTDVGADIMCGSLIKNPGGGIAPTGGYIAGRKKLVEDCSYRLTTPGTGKEIGCTLGNNRELFMGAFSAPHVTGEALKTAIFTSALYELLGYEVTPRYNEERGDIIQALLLGSEKKLISFCQGVQMASPIDSFVTPEPWDMPGYDSKVIMAAGAFTLGSSIELSADAPLREPYAVWMQGSLNFHTGRLASILAAASLEDK